MRIVVEGNIGCGKTTLISKIMMLAFDIFGDVFGPMKPRAISCAPEPVAKWTNLGGVDVLGSYYKDPLRFSGVTQCMISASKIQKYLSTHIDPLEYDITLEVEERSPRSSGLFSEALRCLGRIDEVSFTVASYCMETAVAVEDFVYRKSPKIVVYLQRDTRKCMELVQLRSRIQEIDTVDECLLNELHVQHEKHFVDCWPDDSRDVLVILSDEELEAFHEAYKKRKPGEPKYELLSCELVRKLQEASKECLRRGKEEE